MAQLLTGIAGVTDAPILAVCSLGHVLEVFLGAFLGAFWEHHETSVGVNFLSFFEKFLGGPAPCGVHGSLFEFFWRILRRVHMRMG